MTEIQHGNFKSCSWKSIIWKMINVWFFCFDTSAFRASQYSLYHSQKCLKCGSLRTIEVSIVCATQFEGPYCRLQKCSITFVLRERFVLIYMWRCVGGQWNFMLQPIVEDRHINLKPLVRLSRGFWHLMQIMLYICLHEWLLFPVI